MRKLLPKRLRLLFVFASAVLILSPASTAIAENWIVGSGFWNTPGNWNPSTVPGAGDLVTITPADGVARTITYDYPGPAVTLDELRVDLTGAGTAATTLSMSANNLTSNYQYIGYNGRGIFNHSGGTNTIAAGAGWLVVGYFSGSNGTYNLSGTGALEAHASEYIGDIGTGVFNQTGGSNTIQGADHDLYLGFAASGGGTYTLSAGTLAVNSGDEFIGYNGTGIFNHSGGSNTAGAVIIGANANSPGTYNLSGSGVVSAALVVGNNGRGRFTQSGGTVNTNLIYVAGTNIASEGTYTFSGGTINNSGLFSVSYSSATVTSRGGSAS
jgi:hypothetical protein